MSEITLWAKEQRLTRRQRKSLQKMCNRMDEIVERFKVASQKMAALDRCAVDEAIETLAEIDELLQRYARAGRLTAEAEGFARQICLRYLEQVHGVLEQTKVDVLRDLRLNKIEGEDQFLIPPGCRISD